MAGLKEKLIKGIKIYKKLEKGWLGTFFSLIIGAILAFLFLQFLAFALKTDLPVVAVYSRSMFHENPEITHYSWLKQKFNYSKEFIDSWPFKKGFDVGDMPIIIGAENYSIGDIIVYRVQGQKFPIIHRIVAINEDGSYQTKGDNNINQLEYELNVKKEQISGKVIFIIPKIGYFKVIAYRIFEVVRNVL